MHISTAHLQNRLGQYLDLAATEPVIVEQTGTPLVAMISYQVYQHLLELEDLVWGQQALVAEQEGYLSAEDTLRLLQQTGPGEATHETT